MRVVHLGDALNNLFPQGDEWAQRATRSLGENLSLDSQIVAAAVGTSNSNLNGAVTDTLFVLTQTALGFGQDGSGDDAPTWIELHEIINVDALVDTNDVVEAIEISLNSGGVLRVLWPDWFSELLVEALLDSIRADHLRDAGIEEDAESGTLFFGASENDENLGHLRKPWNSDDVPWPEDLPGVSYLKGHPSHNRRKKGGTMTFGPEGCDINAGGIAGWGMKIDWSHVREITIVGSDEIMFTDQIKVDTNGSAMVLALNDGTELFFEVKGRRPPSLRAEMASLLNMVSTPSIG